MKKTWNQSVQLLILPALVFGSLSVQAEGTPISLRRDLPADLVSEVGDSSIQMDQVRNKQSQLNLAIKKAFGKLDEFCESLELDQIENDATAAAKINSGEIQASSEPKKQTRLQKEISRYKIRLTLPIEVGPLKASYRYSVQPSFVAGEQQRLDVYELKLNIDKAVRAETLVRFTFARNFKGANAKKHAIRACPLWPSHIPTNAIEARDTLDIGEAVRFEVSGLIGLKKDRGLGNSMTSGGISVGAYQEALFLADFYKHSETHVRSRFLGLRNHGQLNFNFDYDLFGQTLSNTILPSSITRHVSVGVGLHLTASYNPFKDYPIDTLMVDYLFNLKNPEAVDALNEIFNNIKRGSILRALLVSDGEELPTALLKLAGKAEAVSIQDQNRNPEEKRIHLMFKGRLQSALTMIEAPLKLTRLLGGFTGTMSWLKTFVSRINERGDADYFVLNSSTRKTQSEAGLSRWEKSDEDRLDILIDSDQKANLKELKDIVIRKEIYDKSFSQKNLNYYRNQMRQSIPNVVQDTNVLDRFFPKGNQTNGRLRYQLNFNQSAMKRFKALEVRDLAAPITAFIDANPERKQEMHLTCDVPKGEGETVSCGIVSEIKAYEIKCAFSDPSVELRHKCLQTTSNEELFRYYILPLFLPTTLPPEEAGNSMQLTGDFSSNETGLRTIEPIGKGHTTEIYRTANFLRQVLNERSMDLRIEEIREGGRLLGINPLNMKH